MYCESLNENKGNTATGAYRNIRYSTAYTVRVFRRDLVRIIESSDFFAEQLRCTQQDAHHNRDRNH